MRCSPAAAALLCGAACLSYPPARQPAAPLPPAWRPREVLRVPIAAGSGATILDERDGLSPDEAALLAVDRNPRLRAIRQERGIAAAEIVAAGLLPNPRFDAALEAPTGGVEARGLGFGAGIAWNVAPLFARGRRLAAAEQAARSVDLEVGWQEWQVAQAARLWSARVIHLTRRLAAAREIEANLQTRLGSLRDALQHGAVTALEVAAAERFLAEARLAGLDLEQGIAGARAELNAVIGLPPTAALTVDAAWQAPQPVPPLAAWLERVPQRRLDLIAMRHAERSYDQALRAEIAAQFPALEIGIRAGRDVEETGSAALSMAIDLPFFDRNQAGVARARARRGRSEAEYGARLLEARAQVARLHRELELVERKRSSAAESSASAARLATLGRQASLAGAITPLAAAELEERAFDARLRELEIAQTAAELWIALVTAAGSDAR